MTEQSLLATGTGEFFQPVRLHYQVFDHNKLLRAFKKLRCLAPDPPQKRWVWLYEHEARDLPFKQSYAQIPKQLHPIVIGSFFLRTNQKLLLDLRSCERATEAILFFDEHLSRKLVRVTHAEVVNKLFSAESAKLTPDSLFDQQRCTWIDPAATERRIIELTAHVQDPQEKLRIFMEDTEARAKQPLPEIEGFPIHFYEEGLQGFTTSLKMRQIIALQHWQGHPDYTMHDVVQLMVKKMEQGR